MVGRPIIRPGKMRLVPLIQASALAERHRWPLWLAVMLGLGAALYFALPSEPDAWTGWAALAAALGLAWAAGRRGGMALALTAALVLGFAAAKARQEQVAAPVLRQEVV